MIVSSTEERLLAGNRDVLALFAGNPFPDAPPKQVRAVIWQYWFTTLAEKRTTGMWWRREFRGLYAPTLTHPARRKASALSSGRETSSRDANRSQKMSSGQASCRKLVPNQQARIGWSRTHQRVSVGWRRAQNFT